MRTKDENKTKAIKHAVIELSQSEGLTNLTTAKVAKLAGVSPATIYLKYKDKTDMLSRIYEEVKTELHAGVQESILDAGDDVEAQLRAVLNYSVQQWHKYPKESEFINALWTNQELLDASAIESGNQKEGPLVDLFARIDANPAFINVPRVILEAFASLPGTVRQLASNNDQALIDQTIDLILKALKV
ncbi:MULTISPECIES: TetR/AcrR family transcriptional regulator [Lactiplantibacillus]|uniref:HTH tetR-type domain-containing protein n=1 Tax=Lactiplantibacillus pentosus TaxID=1589 RepID=A0ABX5D3I4_LACPE|nr:MULTISPECIES: TetR/AcrR family transcriptional regulator [Lactiplantibacillus]MBU7448074.1 TetR/AcrR family transcriptional regulator [Lactiplantibacillus sp. 7.2.4]MBU7480519.1 TetR/AcrR family transcriptional regulator [Lactiplantibacillus pentosus]MBU7503972.1 TetR/AcrR family transcriptional regulator [Lactiplantibacillus pentosus]MCC3163589.1 TetR/AcrR family transcriptional regulator [Lactiplantibacillus pentosus]MCJ8181646.1 TetR/AcrR family transcriptional regulator [Lactiplantibaci